MTSYLTSTRDFLYNRRRPFIVVGGIVGGVYMVANYAITKLTEVQTRMVEERRDRDNLKRRFAQNQEDCSFTILALLPTLGDQLFSHMDVEGLTAKLQRGRQSPAGIESKTPKSASIDDSSFAPGDSTMLMDQRDTSQHAMEEIWNKLGTGKEAKEGKDEKDEAGHGINGIPDHEGGQIAKEEVTMNGAAPSGEESPNGAASAHSKIFPAEASNGSGLNAVSEPVPLPISPSARLPASPSSGPAAVSLKQVGNGGAISENGKAEEMQNGSSEAAISIANGDPALDASHDALPIPPRPKELSPEELLAEKKQKLLLWNELKITAFSRTITTLYSVVLLSLQTHIQLNLLGRYAYLTSVVSLSAPASSTSHRIRLERHDGLGGSEIEEEEASVRDDEELAGGIDVQTERLYLTFSWWFLHEGWKELADDVKDAVQDVFGSLALKTQLTHQDFLLLLNKVRRRVEYEVREDGVDTADGRSDWSENTATTTARRRGKRKTFMSVLFPPTSQEIWVLEKAGAIPSDPCVKSIAQLSPQLPTLLDETKDLLESNDFSRILRLSLSRVFEVFEGTLRPTFGVEPAMTTNEVDGLLRQSSAAASAAIGGRQSSSGRFQQLTDDEQAGVRVRLASLFPAVARQSSTAINGVPNEYVEALTEIKELKAFSAVIYSSWS